MTYKIVRLYLDPRMRPVTIKTGLTEKQVQKHCSNPETSSRTATLPDAKRHTEQYGHWFDSYGYDKETP